MRPVAPLTAGVVLLGLVAFASCKKAEESSGAGPYTGPPPVGAAEKERGVAACEDYRSRVCKCVETNPALREDCDLAPARISAIELSMRMADAENASNDDRAVAISNARRTMQKCIERASELAVGCPAPPPIENDGEPGNVR